MHPPIQSGRGFRKKCREPRQGVKVRTTILTRQMEYLLQGSDPRSGIKAPRETGAGHWVS